MNEKETYVATVTLLIEVEEGQDPRDAVNEMLSNNLQMQGPNGEPSAIVDWRYCAPDYRAPELIETRPYCVGHFPMTSQETGYAWLLDAVSEKKD